MTTVQHVIENHGPATPAASAEEISLVAGLRSGDEHAFMMLIERYHSAMFRLALIYAGSHAVAEEVVQETWLSVIQGIGRFEGRSSLKTWLFRILTNRAKTRGMREGRSVPFSALRDPADDSAEPSVEPERFDNLHGHWTSSPGDWSEVPEERLLSSETQACIQAAIAALPPNQRTVITMRDVEGWGAEEVCNVLGISESNQRVLLHRARSKVRQALDHYLREA
jgi:RNA polymerase sigma-70 factor, ECF subfamily